MSNGKEIQPANPNENKVVLDLKNHDTLDLTNLSSEQQAGIQNMYLEKMVDLHAKAADMKIDVQALDATLTSFNAQVERATQAETAATLQHSQTTSIGRTEIIIGNTGKAASGKLSNTAAGGKDNTLLIVGIIAAAIIIAALILK